MRGFLRTYAPYLVLTLAIMLPLLMPGYILTLDLVFTPHLHAPGNMSNDWLWQNLLHYLNFAVPSQVIEKALLLSIPLLAGIGMHQLLRDLKEGEEEPDPSWHWARYAGGILYAISPFTYSRFMTGQYAVLLGYALMPFFVRYLLAFLDKPNLRSITQVTVLSLVVSVISAHAIGEMALVVGVLFVWAILRQSPTVQKIACAKWALVGLVAFLILSSYWLVPLVMGKGSTAGTINQFSGVDSATFATTGNGLVGKLGSVLRLQGFWAESRNLYQLPQAQLLGWGTLRLIIWALVILGAITSWRQRHGLSVALGLIGLLSITFALGIPQGLLTHLGYREPQKFVGLLSLVFCIFLTFGTNRILHSAYQRSEGNYTGVATALLLVVLVFTPTMYWGFGGQLKPREYPSSWRLANVWLNQTNTSGQILFLPWHEYMSFDFSGRIIGNPAARYFDKPIIVSNNPELGQLGQPHNDPTKLALSEILARPDDQFAARLAKLHIKYILLARGDGYNDYRYLDGQSQLHLVWERSGLKIYRNDASGGAR